MMERNVMAMEAGNHETDDSDAKQKYEGQKQLNIQVGSHWSILTTILSSDWSRCPPSILTPSWSP